MIDLAFILANYVSFLSSMYSIGLFNQSMCLSVPFPLL